MTRACNVLGPLRVVIDEVDVTRRAPKERSLLALLVVHHGRILNADRITDELWPDLDPERARRVLWVRVAGLRALLKQAGAGALLQLEAPGYRLGRRAGGHRCAAVPGRARPVAG